MKNWKENVLGVPGLAVFALCLTVLLFFILPAWLSKHSVVQINAQKLYRDGIVPARNSDDGFFGEVIKITTPTTSKAVILAIRQSMSPGGKVSVHAANALSFAIGDETMQVGEKVHVKQYWHVPNDQLGQNYSVWLAFKLSTNQVAEKK